MWIWAIWGHFSNLLDDASLRFAFRRGHSLNVRVHGHTNICMAHQCLHRRHIFTVRFEQRTNVCLSVCQLIRFVIPARFAAGPM